MKVLSRGGKEHKFQRSQWLDKLQEPDFRQVVLAIMDEEIIKKFESEGKNVNIDPED